MFNLIAKTSSVLHRLQNETSSPAKTRTQEQFLKSDQESKNFDHSKFNQKVRYSDWSNASFKFAEIGLKSAFSECNLENVDFIEADISGRFDRANLENTNFLYASFRDESMLNPDSCNITGANFIGAQNLGGAFKSSNDQALLKAKSQGAITTPDDLLKSILDPNVSPKNAVRLCKLAINIIETFEAKNKSSNGLQHLISNDAKELFYQLRTLYNSSKPLDEKTWQAAQLIENIRNQLETNAIKARIDNNFVLIEEFQLDY